MRLFYDDRGMTTTGMVLALLITLSLIFTSGQVQRIQSAASEVQAVSDAAALAAENEVAEFVIVARVCDAVLLTMSLTSLAAVGLGVAALCIPATASVGEALLQQGKQLIEARNNFADKAEAGLNKLQRLLPYLACANAAKVAHANNTQGASYVALAVLSPFTVDDIEVGQADEVQDAVETAEENARDIKEKAERAQEAASKANEAKQRGFEHDCGAAPGYCMEERASALAGLTGAQNPHFSSVDLWSFSVALKRAKAYYPARLEVEAPVDDSVLEQARSQLRKRYYRYANELLQQGYVHETDDSFDAYFPMLPRNTAQLRETSLYTEQVYPRTANEDGSFVLHAWAGCPNAASASGTGSAAECDIDGYKPCDLCQFDEQSLGSVAEASTSIPNGFENHYRQVSQAAEDYEKALDELNPLTEEVKGSAGGVFDKLREALRSVANKRINVAPPGKNGVIALVANTSAQNVGSTFASNFVQQEAVLGARAAVSAATLLEDPSSEGKNVLTSLLDGFKQDGGAAVGAAGVVLECWSGLLSVYTDGQQALGSAIEQALNSLPLIGPSGLGTWAKGALSGAIEDCGLAPANLNAVKPVLVNSAHVAALDESAFGARLLSIKQQAVENPLQSNGLFSSVISTVEQGLQDTFVPADGKVEIARIELIEGVGPTIPIEISLPPAVSSAVSNAISSAADALRSLVASVVGERVWE